MLLEKATLCSLLKTANVGCSFSLVKLGNVLSSTISAPVAFGRVDFY